MLFGGLQRITLVDYPKKIAATVFTIGCNFYCPFCHNPELVDQNLIKNQPKISEQKVLDFLKERKDFLQGLCITGGEPTLQKDLKNFIKKVKKFGYLVKLDTNGSNPIVLKELITEKLVDYVAMDIKAPLKKYHLYTKGIDFTPAIKKSIKILMNSKIDYEFRTTLDPLNLTEDDILKISQMIKGAKAYYLQQFHNFKTLDYTYKELKPLKEEKIRQLIEKIKPFFKICALR
ncbi:MAG: anaerobic ribonucleoside-triphosphate reductase activating protein [Minisyncoccia bacterium]